MRVTTTTNSIFQHRSWRPPHRSERRTVEQYWRVDEEQYEQLDSQLLLCDRYRRRVACRSQRGSKRMRQRPHSLARRVRRVRLRAVLRGRVAKKRSTTQAEEQHRAYDTTHVRLLLRHQGVGVR